MVQPHTKGLMVAVRVAVIQASCPLRTERVLRPHTDFS